MAIRCNLAIARTEIRKAFMPEQPLDNWELPVGGKMKRPRLSIPRTQAEVFCDLIAAAVVIGITVYLIAIWASLPASIPVHFNFSGQVDRWGNRNVLFLTSAVMLAMYTGLTILQRFPHIYNYPFGLTPENVHRQYQVARQLLTLIKTEVVCLFAFIQWQTVSVARGRGETLGIWFLPFMLFVLFGTFAYYFVQASKAK
jgi:hypothetical protein